MKSKSNLLLVTIIMLSSFAAACGWAEAGNPVDGMSNHGDREVVPLLDYMGILSTVQVGIGDQILPFFFDTGGGLTVITPTVADRLGLRQFGRVTGFRMNGERLDLTRCDKTDLQIGSRKICTEPMVFNLMSLLPEGLPEVYGVVSLHTFQDQAITLDLASVTIVIETEDSLPQTVKTKAPLSIRVARQAGGTSIALMVEVKAQTGTLWLEIDTGNVGPVILAHHALIQLGLIFASHAHH